MDGITLSRVIEAVVLPPGGLILLGILGLIMARGLTAAVGRGILLVMLILLYLFSIPVTASLLARTLQYYPPQTPADLASAGAGAIVVLAAGQRAYAPEYGGATVSARTLERIRFAARVHRGTGLPILASGGWVLSDGEPEAKHLAKILETDFGIAPIWTETISQTTRENARDSARVLSEHAVDAIVLVTDAGHMPRAARAFRGTGLRVTPAPTAHYDESVGLLSLKNWLPSGEASSAVRFFLREMLGTIWYRYRDGTAS